MPKFRNKIPTKGSRKKEKLIKEFKFHYVGDITRRKVLEEIASNDIKIYILIVDKMGRKIQDSPENYGKLIKNLSSYLIRKEIPKEILIDKHFGNRSDTQELQSILDSINHQIEFKQVDSIADPRIDLADFIAGAILRKLRINDETFYNIFFHKITLIKNKKWNKL